MKNYFAIHKALLVMLATISCAMAQTRDDTKSIGLLIKSVSNAAETFQTQRDLIAVAELRNRNVLERLAIEFEAKTITNVSVWELSGQTERKRLFDGIRQSSENALALKIASDKRAEEQALAVTKARSAVNFQIKQLNQASAGYVKLGEPRSGKEEVDFITSFIRNVRADIAKTNEAAAKTLSSQAAESLNIKGAQ